MHTFRTLKNNARTVLLTSMCLIMAAILLAVYVRSTAHAFQVAPLPDDNLITNPWFRSASDPTAAGLDGWTNVLVDSVGWGTSQKESNPSPDIVISGTCGNEPVYCGTAARWAEQEDGTYPGIDVYLYQVVSADPAHRTLRFFTHWVTHRVEVAEVAVYGGGSPNGPWALVWVPFFHTQDEVIKPPGGDQVDLWKQTAMLETTLDSGFPNYKIEIQGRLPEGDGVGFKITGLYFGAEDSGSGGGDERPTATPMPSPTRLPGLFDSIWIPILQN